MQSKFASLAVFLLSIFFTQTTFAIAASGNPGNGDFSFLICEEAQCHIGSFPDPLVVEWDPTAGPWIKQFSGLNSSHTSIVIHEFLLVGGSVPFTDWHEELINTPPGWGWNPASTTTGVYTGGASAVPVPGLEVSFAPGPNGNPNGTIWFDFDPLLPGTQFEIWKELVFTGAGTPGSITILEFPTVPIPPALWLFGTGILALCTIRNRRS